MQQKILANNHNKRQLKRQDLNTNPFNVKRYNANQKTIEDNIYYSPSYSPAKTISKEIKIIYSETLLASSPIFMGFVIMFASIIQTL